jgi:hypothetical protein
VSSPNTDSEQPFRAKWRWIISLFVTLHVAAVFIPPFTFATSTGMGEASPLAAGVHEILRPYVQFCYLDHGYFFFAPNPGATHLIRCELTYDDDRRPEEIWIPDLDSQSPPRLFYHRHFMIAEALNAGFTAPQPSAEVQEQPGQVESWRRRREVYERRFAAIQEHLKLRYNAKEVKLTRVEHRPPSPYEFLVERVRLSDPRLYQDLPEDGSGGPTP